MKKGFKKSLEMMLLLSGFLFPAFGAAKTKAEAKPKKIIESVEESVKKSGVNLIFDYETEKTEPINYKTKNTIFLPWPINIRKKNTNISSYQKLILQAKNLSEEEKLIQASKISFSSGWDLSLENIEVMPQNEFFYNLQNSLPVGVCKQIATHTERFLNDVRIKTAAVTGVSKNGVGHVYDISKTEDGTTIIDYSKILKTNTKNIEKTLELYQKLNKKTAFQHLFFEDAKFKYRLITEDGRNFIDFIKYDESSESLKNSLIYNLSQQNSKISLNLGNYLNSAKFNLGGFFLKLGEIKGKGSSPLEKLILSQAGFKRNFSISDFTLSPEISLINGNLNNNNNNNNNNNSISGISGNLIINKNRRKGLNISTKIAGTLSGTQEADLFYDFTFGEGGSYKIPIKNIQIEPYIVSQFAYFPKEIGAYKFMPEPTEIVAGINLTKSKNPNLSIEPYYLWKKWEKGIGANAKLGNKHFGINASGEITKSNYEFCPDKQNLSIGAYLALKNLAIRADYETKTKNYDGEKESHKSLNFSSSLKF